MSGQLKLLNLLKHSFNSEGNRVHVEGKIPPERSHHIPAHLSNSNLCAIGYAHGLLYAADVIDTILQEIKSEASKLHGTSNLCDWCLRPLSDGEVDLCASCRKGDTDTNADEMDRYSIHQNSEVSTMDKTNFICISPCPKLDADGDTHCRCLNEEARDNFQCPFGLTPVWDEYE